MNEKKTEYKNVGRCFLMLGVIEGARQWFLCFFLAASFRRTVRTH